MSEEENRENSTNATNEMTNADYSDDEDWILEQYCRICNLLPKLKPPVSNLTPLLRIVDSWIQDLPQYHKEANKLEAIINIWRHSRCPDDEALQQFVEKYQIPEVVTIQNGGREKETIGHLGPAADMQPIQEGDTLWTVDLKTSEEEPLLTESKENYQIPEVVAIQNGGREKETVGHRGPAAAEDCMRFIQEEDAIWTLDLKTEEELMEPNGEASAIPETIMRHTCDYEPEQLILKLEDVTEEQVELKTSGTPVSIANCSSELYTKASSDYSEKNCHDTEADKSPNISAAQKNGTSFSFPFDSDPVEILHKLEPYARYEITSVVGPQNRMMCSVTYDIRGKKYTGINPNDKLATSKAARMALKDLLGFDFPVLAGIENLSADLIRKKFEELSEGRSSLKCSVYAAVIMTIETDPGLFDARVIAVTSGTKCILHEHLSSLGESINDCHAEISALRCANDFLITQVETAASSSCRSSECVERNSSDTKYRLKPGVQFHLFVSRTPCGDSREHPTNGNDGHLQLKIQNCLGTHPVETERPNDVRCTKSCSDKLMECNVVGIQGAALSKIMEPVCLSSVLVGEHFNKEHLLRALFGRISDIENLPEGYHLNQPYISSFSFSKIPLAKKIPKNGFCWVEGWSEIEEIDQRTGMLTNNCVSKLSKREKFERITKLYTFTYGDLKSAALPYQKTKSEVYKLLERKGHGACMQSSCELDNFSLESVNYSPI